MSQLEKIFYIHYRTNFGAMTFAIKQPKGTDSGLAGCAFCSPDDMRFFSRKLGRRIAMGRLATAPIRFKMDGTLHDVARRIIESMADLRVRYEKHSRQGSCHLKEPGIPQWFPAFAITLKEQRSMNEGAH